MLTKCRDDRPAIRLDAVGDHPLADTAPRENEPRDRGDAEDEDDRRKYHQRAHGRLA